LRRRSRRLDAAHPLGTFGLLHDDGVAGPLVLGWSAGNVHGQLLSAAGGAA
jgi:hypothetical protein